MRSAILFLLAGVMPGYAQPGNLLANAWFDDGYRGWVLDPALEKAGRVQVAGAGSLRLEPNALNTTKDKPFGVGQMLSTSSLAQRTLTVRGAMKSNGAAGLILAFVLDARGKPVAKAVLTQLDASEEYRPQRQTLTVPNNAARIVFALVTPSRSGAVSFSDLFIGIEEAGGVLPTAPSRAAINIDATHVLRTIPREMFGTNVEWVRDGNSLWDRRAGVVRAELADAARQLGTTIIRYPGGGFADYYHWRDGIGPADQRRLMKHNLDSGKSAALFGTHEVVAFARSIGAEPMLQVNVVTGTAQEAAEWVAYCNQPQHAERARNGSPEPFRVRYWEIGNEPYIKPDGKLPLPGDSYLSPERYAAKFLEYAAAMRAVDPEIQLGAVGGKNFGYYRLMHDDNWDEVVLTQAGKQIDFLAVHNAYAPLLVDRPKAVAIDDAYRAMFAFPRQVAQNLRDVNRDIERFGGSGARHIQLAITEWGPLFGFDVTSPYIDHVKTLGSALYVASLFQTFLHAERLDLLAFFKLTDQSFMGWVNGMDAEPKPVFYALQMYSRHFGTRLIETQVEGPVFESKQAGLSQAQSGVPYLAAAASLSGDGSRLYLIVVNTHLSESLSVRITVNGFQPAGQAQSWTLTGPTLDANNGGDMRGQGRQAGTRIDKGKPGAVRPVEGKLAEASQNFNYSFVPRSVTALELKKAP